MWLWVALAWATVLPESGEAEAKACAAAMRRWINSLFSGSRLTALKNSINHDQYCALTEKTMKLILGRIILGVIFLKLCGDDEAGLRDVSMLVHIQTMVMRLEGVARIPDSSSPIPLEH
eukprot:5506347-Amphidinium_carterae.1